MKIIAVAKKLTHEGDHLHGGHFFVGEVKTFFAGSALGKLSDLKNSLANEFASALQNRLYSAISEVTGNLPLNLASSLNDSLTLLMQNAINSSIGDRLAGNLSDLAGDALSSAASNLVGSALTDLQGQALDSADGMISNLHSLVDNDDLGNAVTGILSQFESDLGGDYSSVVSAATGFINDSAKDIMSDLATDTFNNIGKPLDSLLDGDLGDQISDALGSGLGSSVKNAISSGGKIIIGASDLLGSVPSLSGLGKSTILGKGNMIVGAGKKMIALAEGKLAFAGGLSLSAAGLVGGSGSSAFSLGPSGLSLGGKNLTEMLAPTPSTKSVASYTLEADDAGGVVTMDYASANTLTIPPNSDVGFKVGTEINIIQVGAGQTSIAPGSGVQLYSGNSHRKISRQYGKVTIIKKDTNQWILFGDIAA